MKHFIFSLLKVGGIPPPLPLKAHIEHMSNIVVEYIGQMCEAHIESYICPMLW